MAPSSSVFSKHPDGSETHRANRLLNLKLWFHDVVSEQCGPLGSMLNKGFDVGEPNMTTSLLLFFLTISVPYMSISRVQCNIGDDLMI